MMTGRTPALWLLASAALACGCEPSAPHPGFDETRYAKIGANGQRLEPGVPTWSCALDNFTGLLWEIKTDAAGLHDWRNTYSWHNPEESNEADGLDYRGLPDGGDCASSECDTWAYPRAVNEAGLCGYNDWRVPARDELASLSDPARADTPPTINMRIFPYTQPDEFWSANDYHFQHDAAWLWNFRFGHDRVEWKKSTRRVRLVRGKALHLTPVKD